MEEIYGPLLPNDLVTRIIPWLWDDLKALKSCSLVNHSFCGITQRIIFENYYFGFHYRIFLNALTQLTRSFQHIFPTIRHFSVSAQFLRTEEVAVPLSMMNGLESFEVQRHDSEMIPQLVMNILRKDILPSIRHLHLDDIITWSHQIPTFLQRCTNLSSLSCVDEVPDASTQFLTLTIPEIPLKVLHLHLDHVTFSPSVLEKNIPTYLSLNNVAIEEIHFSTLRIFTEEDLLQPIIRRIIDAVSKFSGSVSHVVIGQLLHPDWQVLQRFPFEILSELKTLSFHITFDEASKEDGYGEWDYTGTLIWLTQSIQRLSKDMPPSSLRNINILIHSSPVWFSQYSQIVSAFRDFDLALATKMDHLFPELERVTVSVAPHRCSFMGMQFKNRVTDSEEKSWEVDFLFPMMREQGIPRVKEMVYHSKKWWEANSNIEK